MMIRFPCVVILVIACFTIHQQFTLSNALTVRTPLSLQGSFFSALAAFGPPSVTTRRQVGEVVFAEPASSCKDFYNSDSFFGRVVFMRRGGCSFAEKALRAQQHGAAGVVIINNEKKSSCEEERNHLFLMADDGNVGWSVAVPVEMIASCDADLLYDHSVVQRKSVIVSLGQYIPMVSYFA